MKRRSRPKQHKRRLKNGKVITVNKGVKRRSKQFIVNTPASLWKFNQENKDPLFFKDEHPYKSQLALAVEGGMKPRAKGNLTVAKVGRSKRVKRRSKSERQKVSDLNHAIANNKIEELRKNNLSLARKVWNSKADLDDSEIRRKVAYNNHMIDKYNKQYFEKNPR